MKTKRDGAGMLLSLVIASMLSSRVMGDTLYYGGDPGGSPQYTAYSLNQTLFSSPDVAQYDDFKVPIGQNWNVTSLFANVEFQGTHQAPFNNPSQITSAQYHISQGLSAGSGGTLLFGGNVPCSASYLSNGADGYYEYQLGVGNLQPIILSSGTYWLSLRPIGQNIDNVLSFIYETDGVNGIGSTVGDGLSYETITGGIQYQPESVNYSMGVIGTVSYVPEPASLSVLSLAAVTLLRRRRP